MGDSSTGGGKRLGRVTLGVGVAAAVAVAAEVAAGGQLGAAGGGSF